MCFDTSECDWYAAVQIVTSGVSPLAARCGECGVCIAPFAWRRHIYQQECEECQRCEELPAGEECEEHDYGETCVYDRCENCDKILRAIEAYELRQGCRSHEATPLIGNLQEELCVNNRPDAGVYAAVALETFPELGQVEWLIRLVEST